MKSIIRTSKLPGARTRASVDRSVIGRTPNEDMGKLPMYLSCKYNPFEQNKTGKGYIPDGRGKNVLLRDYKSSFDFEVTKPFAVRVAPTYPCPIRVYQPDADATSMKINGASVPKECLVVNPTGSLPGSGTDGVWYSAGNMVNYVNPSAYVDQTHNISSGRAVSVGYRLVYTGKAAEANGLVIVDSVPEKIDAYIPSNTKKINYIDNAGTQNDIPVGTADLIGAPCLVVDSITGKSAFEMFPADQYVGRPENGVHGVLKSRVRGTNHEYKPWWEAGAVAVADSQFDPLIALAASPALNSLAGAKAVGLNFWDDQLEAINIRITGIGSYRLETVSCFEFEYPPSSALIDLTVSSPPPNDAVLRMDDSMAHKAIAQPFSQAIMPVERPRPVQPIVFNNYVTQGGGRKPNPRAKTVRAGKSRRGRDPRLQLRA